MGLELLHHKGVQHFLREKRLFVAEGFPDEDEGHDGLTAGVEAEGVEGIQRLLGGLMEREVEQEAAVVFAAALVSELVGLAVEVEPVEALVQRQVGAELAQAGGAVLLRRVFSRRVSSRTMTPSATASRMMEMTAFMEPS